MLYSVLFSDKCGVRLPSILVYFCHRLHVTSYSSLANLIDQLEHMSATD